MYKYNLFPILEERYSEVFSDISNHENEVEPEDICKKITNIVLYPINLMLDFLNLVIIHAEISEL